MKRIASVAVLAATFSLAFAGLAQGARSHVTLHIDDDGPDPSVTNDVRGQVFSPRQACESFRTVRVFRVVDGAANDDTLVAVYQTNANGRYVDNNVGNISNGRYYAVVRRDGNCRRDVSNEQVVVGGPDLR